MTPELSTLSYIRHNNNNITMKAREYLTVRIKDDFNTSTTVYAITEERYENMPACMQYIN